MRLGLGKRALAWRRIPSTCVVIQWLNGVGALPQSSPTSRHSTRHYKELVGEIEKLTSLQERSKALDGHFLFKINYTSLPAFLSQTSFSFKGSLDGHWFLNFLWYNTVDILLLLKWNSES